MPNDDEFELEEAQRLALQKELEKARSYAFALMTQLYGLGKVEVFKHELFQYIDIFGGEGLYDKDFEQLFLQQFGSPDITDPIRGMICAYEGYRQALKVLWDTIKNSGVANTSDEVWSSQAGSTVYCGRHPRFIQ